MGARSFREAGWVWEGFATHGGIWPTIYGVGEGARYFGLDKLHFMFHPNTEQNLAKVAEFGEVVADISKWKFKHVKNESGYEIGFTAWHDGTPETVRAEAENLGRLSLNVPNLTGGIIDDFTVLVDRYGCTVEQQKRLFAALRSGNPALKMWVVVYHSQLDKDYWPPIASDVDIVNLWVGKSDDLPNLTAYVDRCAEVFPGKPIIVGSYLHDYGNRCGMAMDLLRTQYEIMLRLWETGKIQGYSIIGGALIDQDVIQAEWVRSFLAEH